MIEKYTNEYDEEFLKTLPIWSELTIKQQDRLLAGKIQVIKYKITAREVLERLKKIEEYDREHDRFNLLYRECLKIISIILSKKINTYIHWTKLIFDTKKVSDDILQRKLQFATKRIIINWMVFIRKIICKYGVVEAIQHIKQKEFGAELDVETDEALNNIANNLKSIGF